MWSVIIFISVGLPDEVLVEMGCYERGEDNLKKLQKCRPEKEQWIEGQETNKINDNNCCSVKKLQGCLENGP